MTENPKLSELLELPPEERLALIEALWDSLIEVPENVAVPDWHRAVVSERMADDGADERPGDTWAEVRSRIEKRE